jgi:hypothetical protein
MARQALTFFLLLGVAVSSLTEPAMAGQSGTFPGRGGVLGCAGSVYFANQGREIHTTTWIFRNFGGNEISIRRLLVTDANGVVHCDYPAVDDFPEGFKSTIPPMENTKINTAEMSDCDNPLDPLPRADRPLQVRIEWVSPPGGPVTELYGGALVRINDTINGATLAEHSVMCVTLKFER